MALTNRLLSIKEASEWATKYTGKETVFSITVDDIQNEALERINRRLTDDEIDIAKKGLANGLGTLALDITYHTIFTEMINENRN